MSVICVKSPHDQLLHLLPIQTPYVCWVHYVGVGIVLAEFLWKLGALFLEVVHTSLCGLFNV